MIILVILGISALMTLILHWRITSPGYRAMYWRPRAVRRRRRDYFD